MNDFYNNGMPNGQFMPQNPYLERLNAMTRQGGMMPMQQEIVRVNGKEGAEAYRLAPNSSVLLLDETAPLVWCKMTDGAGYPTMTAYEITPYTPPAPPDYSTIDARMAQIETTMQQMQQLLSKMEGMTNESNIGSAPRKRSAAADANAAAEK